MRVWGKKNAEDRNIKENLVQNLAFYHVCGNRKTRRYDPEIASWPKTDQARHRARNILKVLARRIDQTHPEKLRVFGHQTQSTRFNATESTTHFASWKTDLRHLPVKATFADREYVTNLTRRIHQSKEHERKRSMDPAGLVGGRPNTPF